MAHEGPSENLVSTNECPRLLLLQQGEPNSRQPLLPDTSLPPIERMEADKPPCKSQKGATSSAPPGEDVPQFPQESSSSDDDDLLDALNRLDVETDQGEPYTASSRQGHQDLEAYDHSSDNDGDVHSPPTVSPRSIAEIIYAENEKKARLAHAVLDKCGPKVTEPLYHQPSDTAIYRENKKKYQEFKRTLMLHFKRKAQEGQARAGPLSYSRNEPMPASENEMRQGDNRAEWKANEQSQRQFFEEQFPELKKTRREQLQLATSLAKPGKRKRMGADMQVILGLQKPEKKERRKLNCAIIPSVLSDEQRPPHDVDFRNLVQDPLAELKERHSANVWDDREKKVFRETFLQHPKKFATIASYLDRKSVADCIQYYYLSKKSENYKQLTRKQRSRVTLHAPQQNTMASSVPVHDSASSSGISNLATLTTTEASAPATSGMDMTETIIFPSTTDATASAAATSSSGNAVAPAPPPGVDCRRHTTVAPTPSPSQDKWDQLD
ncbi:hypothetical protein HPB48_004646 [Haemaphysalis longicornis]|uniref:SANT domain-containing protein n=1 Tax=Haemaphysalis longicornis TaxID=44386 RepID=A0A9J6G0U6_HAELO|nr:hypothetical protein HPB48_004646 [Haemaphysalis longicornis]